MSGSKQYTFGKFEAGRIIEDIARENQYKIGNIYKFLKTSEYEINLIKLRFEDVPDFKTRLFKMYLVSVETKINSFPLKLRSFIKNYLFAIWKSK